MFSVVENISIFDFKLAPEEMEELDTVETRIRLFLFDLCVRENTLSLWLP